MNDKQQKIVAQFKIDNAEILKNVNAVLLEDSIKEFLLSIEKDNTLIIKSREDLPGQVHTKLCELYNALKET